ncbi:hypothetical protein [Anoxybacillus sp. J5B_2022]|uniref:hypothetical protein n=1 Tax=Anoxybacillus sp. J5B_2022 TaxID=3003246 RepID=UPI002286179A|nr:hypothetical protein [Anoxybacillus sp. J5B_2022]MCZ0755618.1 hypothetical protein [Anoxybacillus sp. J5B_2022]
MVGNQRSLSNKTKFIEQKENLIMKFHGHDHSDGTPEEISEFDPFHIHKKKDSFDTQAAFRESEIV